MKPSAEVLKNALWAVVSPGIIALVGWFATIYMQRPEITGSILVSAYGDVPAGELYVDARRSVTVFVALENQRDATVTPIKYLLEYKRHGFWSGGHHPYYRDHPGVTLGFKPEEVGISSAEIKRVFMRFPRETLLTETLNEPIKKGESRRGMLVYALPADMRSDEIRIRIIDASQREYVIDEAPHSTFDPRMIPKLDKRVELREVR